MTILIIYFAILIILLASFIYSNGIKKGFLESIILFILGFAAVIIERIIDKQFDIITLILGLIVVCLIFFYIWLKKRIWNDNEKNGKKKKNKSKKRKKKK